MENFLAVSDEDGGTRLVVHPERRPEVANPTLAMIAGEARDIAVMLSAEFRVKIPGLAKLDAALKAHYRWENSAGEPSPGATG